MRWLPLLLVACALTPSLALTQAEERHFVGASFGGSDFHLRDEHASPLIFSHIGIAPEVRYSYRGEQYRHFFEVSYSAGDLQTTSDGFFTTSRRAGIRYAYVQSVAVVDLADRPLAIFLGGSLSSFLSHAEYYYLFIPPSYARSIESWYWSNSVDLAMQCEFRPGSKESVTLRLFMPLLSSVSRPTYSPSGDFNYTDNDWKFKQFGRTMLFPKNFAVNARLSYQRKLFGGFDIQFSYEFFYAYYAEPREITLYMNNVRGGVFFCF
jgi:hypothetical protein